MTRRFPIACAALVALAACSAGDAPAPTAAAQDGPASAAASADWPIPACRDDSGWDDPATPFHVHGNTWYVGTCGISALLVTSPDGHVVVDGATPAAGEQILANIRTLGFDPADVRAIVFSHEHFDHVGGLGELKEATGAPIYAHPDAVEMLAQADKAAALWGFHLDPPPPPDSLLAEGDVLAVGNLRLHVLHTPGHAPGHVCFYLPVDGALIDGDVLFQQGIGRTDLPGGDYALLMRSIREKILTLPDETRLYPGHGDPTTVGDERAMNPFLGDFEL